MWDNAPLLRNIANTLLVGSVLAILYGAAYYLVHLPEVLPLRSVRLNIVPQQVAADQVLQVLRSGAQGNFVTVDIEKLKASLESLPWVRSVNIRREFPDRLAVLLEEHQALARWNSDTRPMLATGATRATGKMRLVNYQGEIFVAQSDRVLPSFIGPEGSSSEVTHYYAQFSQQLEVLGLHAEQLALSPRYAWQIRLNNGTVLKLGREDMQQRLARFVAVYPYTEDRIQKTEDGGTVAYVDLRYRNGFSVRHIENDKG